MIFLFLTTINSFAKQYEPKCGTYPGYEYLFEQEISSNEDWELFEIQIEQFEQEEAWTKLSAECKMYLFHRQGYNSNRSYKKVNRTIDIYRKAFQLKDELLQNDMDSSVHLLMDVGVNLIYFLRQSEGHHEEINTVVEQLNGIYKQLVEQKGLYDETTQWVFHKIYVWISDNYHINGDTDAAIRFCNAQIQDYGQYFEENPVLAETDNPTSDIIQLNYSNIHNTVGAYYEMKGRLDSAYYCYDKGLRLFEQIDFRAETLSENNRLRKLYKILYNVQYLERLRGGHDKASAYFERMKDIIYQDDIDIDLIDVLDFFSEHGNQQINQGDIEQGLASFRQSIEIFYEYYDDNEYAVDYWSNLLGACINHSYIEKAEEYIDKCIALRDQKKYGSNKGLGWGLEQDIAEYFYLKGNHTEAKAIYKRLLNDEEWKGMYQLAETYITYFEKYKAELPIEEQQECLDEATKILDQQTEVNYVLGQRIGLHQILLKHQNNIQSALDETLPLWEGVFKTTNDVKYLRYPDLAGIIAKERLNLLKTKVNQTESIPNLKQYAEELSRVIEMYCIQEKSLSSVGAQQQINIKKKATIAELIPVLYQLYNKTQTEYWALEALKYSDICKSHMVTDNLPFYQAKQNEKDQSLFVKDKEMRREILACKMALDEMWYIGDKTEIYKLEVIYTSLLNEYDDFLAEYPNRQWSEQKLKIDYSNFKTKIANESLVLDYVYTAEGISVLAMTNKGVLDWFLIEEVEQVDNTIQKVMDQTAQRSLKWNTTDEYWLKSTLLPKKLNAEKIKRLVIIAERNIAKLPFDLLPVSEDRGSEFLINDFEISNIYTPSLLLYPSHKSMSLETAGFAMQYQNTTLPFLKWSADELKKVEEVFPRGDYYYDKEANIQTFFNHYETADWIHFSGHALQKEDRPLESVIYMYGEEGMDSIPLYECLFLNGQPKMVVLSACETGVTSSSNTPLYNQMSFAKALAYSGTSNLLMTKWSVNEKTTNEIMKGFYDYVKAGKSTTAALRLAKLDYLNNQQINERRAPYFWAGISYSGLEMQAENQWPWYWWLLGALILIMTLILFYVRRKK